MAFVWLTYFGLFRHTGHRQHHWNIDTIAQSSPLFCAVTLVSFSLEWKHFKLFLFAKIITNTSIWWYCRLLCRSISVLMNTTERKKQTLGNCARLKMVSTQWFLIVLRPAKQMDKSNWCVHRVSCQWRSVPSWMATFQTVIWNIVLLELLKVILRSSFHLFYIFLLTQNLYPLILLTVFKRLHHKIKLLKWSININ